MKGWVWYRSSNEPIDEVQEDVHDIVYKSEGILDVTTHMGIQNLHTLINIRDVNGVR